MFLRWRRLLIAGAVVATSIVAPVVSGQAYAAITSKCADTSGANSLQISFPVKSGTEATFHAQPCIYFDDSTDAYQAEVFITAGDGDHDFPTGKGAFQHFEIIIEVQDNDVDMTGGNDDCPDLASTLNGMSDITTLDYECGTVGVTGLSAADAITADGYIRYELGGKTSFSPTWQLHGSPSF